MSTELLSRVRGQGWGAVEEVYIRGDRMEGPRWFLEIKEGLKVSKLLMELENDHDFASSNVAPLNPPFSGVSVVI